MARFIALSLGVLVLGLPLGASQGNQAPCRIVSLYPGHSENIVALGAGDRLIALSASDDKDLLPHLPRLPAKVGGERILSLKPDLVIVRTFTLALNPSLAKTLDQAGVRLLCLDPPLWDAFDGYLVTLADALAIDGREALARVRAIRERLGREAGRRRQDRERPRVFLEATADRLHTCAPGSWPSGLIALAGGENIAAGEGNSTKTIMSWGVERLLKNSHLGLDIYLVQQGTMNRSTVEEIRSRPWMKAFGNVRIETIEEGLMSRPSLLGLEKGGLRLLEIFYPPKEAYGRD